MDFYDELGREEESIIEELNRGEITQREADRLLRDLAREAQYRAEDAAQGAYDEEMGRW